MQWETAQSFELGAVAVPYRIGLGNLRSLPSAASLAAGHVLIFEVVVYFFIKTSLIFSKFKKSETSAALAIAIPCCVKC